MKFTFATRVGAQVGHSLSVRITTTRSILNLFNRHSGRSRARAKNSPLIPGSCEFGRYDRSTGDSGTIAQVLVKERYVIGRDIATAIVVRGHLCVLRQLLGSLLRLRIHLLAQGDVLGIRA